MTEIQLLEKLVAQGFDIQIRHLSISKEWRVEIRLPVPADDDRWEIQGHYEDIDLADCINGAICNLKENHELWQGDAHFKEKLQAMGFEVSA